MVQWIAFVLGSVILIAISWSPFRILIRMVFSASLHGEAILGLVIINLPQWFSHGWRGIKSSRGFSCLAASFH